ncbi:MAG: hypothetical protein JST26_16730 [Bacteroidetes bacterium]|nr:hypothetical protein [Bacteroidota bacterium]
MENSTMTESSVSKEIITEGLKKAAESLSFFMKENLQVNETDFNISTVDPGREGASADKLFYVLSTEIKGELTGICFLLFDDSEAEELCRVALSDDIANNPAKLAHMQEPLLLEVDNIISASVITQFANRLKVKMYGDVPRMDRIGMSDFQQIVQRQLEPDKLILGFKTEFVSSKSHFTPDFFWILSPDFMDCVRRSIDNS